MTGLGMGRLGVALGALLAMSACQSGQPLGFLKKNAAADTAAAPASTTAPALAPGEERDVEAPEIFKLSDKALWDGRPSLGGVWVAHATVKEPERVIIRNAANGKSVIGALFRREVSNPGPSLQLSSDAAEALGLLAGQPAVVDVVALKRIEAPAAAPAPAAKPAEAPADAAKTATAEAAPAAGKPKKKPIEAKKLDPVAATAAAAIEKATGKPAVAAAAPTAPAAAAPAAAGALNRAYVQIGIFSVEANAKKAAAQMQKAGMNAVVKPDTSQGKTFWRVIVGPAATVAERDALAAKVKSIGYPDAYPVSK